MLRASRLSTLVLIAITIATSAAHAGSPAPLTDAQVAAIASNFPFPSKFSPPLSDIGTRADWRRENAALSTIERQVGERATVNTDGVEARRVRAAKGQIVLY